VIRPVIAGVNDRRDGSIREPSGGIPAISRPTRDDVNFATAVAK
jgi:hypothetical protein